MHRLLLTAVLLLVSLVQVSFAEEANDPSAPQSAHGQTSTVFSAGSDGAYTYAVPIAVPGFKGIEPQLSLVYNSQSKRRAGDDIYIGPGWTLSGLSSILRTTPGGGVPTFSTAHDLFTLDGMELVACVNSSGNLVWPNDYPTDYRANREAASCKAGGNFTTLRESYLKIQRSGGDYTNPSTFKVWRRDGTQLTYTSIGTIRGVANNVSGDDKAAAFRRRWVLTEVRDTQANANVATITWSVADRSNGYAARPTRIQYAGYKIEFHYGTMPNAIRYATGTQYQGRQNYRLQAITVQDGNSKIRAYRLTYGSSNQTKTSLLTEVREYGSNYTLSSNAITGGSSLPPYKFQYTGDYSYFGKRTINGNFHTSMTVADHNDTGADELLFYQYTQKQNGSTRFTLPENGFRFKTDKTVDATFNPQLPPASVNYASTTTVNQHLGITQRDVSTGHLYAINWEKSGTSSLNTQRLKSYRVGDSGHSVITNLTVDGACVESTEPVQALMGNFDNDGESEVVFGNRVYQVNNGAIQVDNGRRGDLGSRLCANKDFPDHGTAAADIDGDGLDEIIGKAEYMDIRGGKFVRVSMSGSPFAQNKPKWVIRFGDVNGDGLADAVIHDRQGQDKFGVALSRGDSFDAIDWGWASGMDSIDYKEANYGSPRNTVADVNGDGLADFIVHNGFSTASVSPNSSSPLDPLQARVWLSNGRHFFKQSGSWQIVPEFLGAGDFDGDGGLDLVSANPYSGGPSILFYGAGRPNLMQEITDPLGGTTKPKFKPSTIVADDDIPGTRELVIEVVRKNGYSGFDKVTSVTYAEGRFDHKFRKSLGYRVVTTAIPKASDETEKPKVITTYDTSSWAVSGRVKQQDLTYKGTVYQRTINDWYKSPSNQLPLRSYKTRSRMYDRWNTSLIENRTDYTEDAYGNPVTMIERGFGGTNGSGKDDRITRYSYKYNTGAYIVSSPEWQIIGSGTSVSYGNRSNWLHATYFSYDGSTRFWDTPTRGNLTLVQEWKGSNNHSRRRVTETGYDNWGNVTSVKNGRGHVSTMTYDTSKRLFQLSATNPAGHVQQSTWNTKCQLPATSTDANGLVTKFFYDGFCRPIRTEYATGQKEWTSYHSMGNPTAQYIKTRAHSSSNVNGQKYTETRAYINGYGYPIRTTRNGKTDAINDAIVTLQAFDGRGNVTWVSVPLTWSEGGNKIYVGPEKHVRSYYDPIGRETRVENPDGTYRTTQYLTDNFTDRVGQKTNWPSVVHKSEHCFDPGSANTVCEQSRSAMDARGNVNRLYLYDFDRTDHGGSSTAARTTYYQYDLLGRLASVKDPINAEWSYTYNSHGNRTQATDPALGTWTMTYDAMNNLTRQTDNKNQIIDFEYDALNRTTLKRVGSGSTRVDTRYTYDQVRSGYYNKGFVTTSTIWTQAKGTFNKIESDWGKAGKLRREKNTIDGRTYTHQYSYRKNGALANIRLPHQPNSTALMWLPNNGMEYDAAGRTTRVGNYITNVTYNIWDQATRVDYASGSYSEYNYDSTMGRLSRNNVRKPSGSQIDYTQYSYSAGGKVTRQKTQIKEGWLDYTYDYAGRLLTVDNFDNRTAWDQSFTYDKAGSMRSNSRVGTYNYNSKKHAPKSVTQSGSTQNFSYDANGNMTTGMGGKQIVYDGENNVIQVTRAGKVTKYEYAADGSRMKKIENAGTANESVTVYFGMVEIQNWGEGSNEVVIGYPHSDVRLVNGVAAYLHSDQLGNLRMISDASGNRDKRSLYRAYGEEQEWIYDSSASNETRGMIGERFDEDAGLQYLNARYYDPELGLFTQADWLEVTNAGVGTNRYAYAGGDPINRADPSGNAWLDRAFESVFGEGSFDRTFGDGASEAVDRFADRVFGNSSDRQAARDYGTYSRNGGTQGYDDWRVSTGNITRSYARDLGVRGNIVGGGVTDSGEIAVFTQNSPLTAHRFGLNGNYLGSQLVQAQTELWDLAVHELHGGHAIREHVGKSPAYLQRRLQGMTVQGNGFTAGAVAVGSYRSLASANRLTNSVLSRHPGVVEAVRSGTLQGNQRIEGHFSSRTGFEAYRTSPRSEIQMRHTYGARVVIRSNNTVPGGVLIVTSFPIY